MKTLTTIALCLMALSSTQAFGADKLEIFNGKNLSRWNVKEFEGQTNYTLNSGTLRAQCDATASSQYLKQKINLNETPVLNWSWNVNPADVSLRGDERSKQGDDFAARIYAVVDTGSVIPNIKSLNYVWARDEGVGANWANPFYKKARMIVLNNNAKDGSKTITQSRNIKQDFKQYFNIDVATLDGVAIMTDCDNSGGKAKAQYGPLFFSK